MSPLDYAEILLAGLLVGGVTVWLWVALRHAGPEVVELQLLDPISAGEARRLEEALRGLPGVIFATVYSEAARATVRFAPEIADYRTIRHQVDRFGHRAVARGTPPALPLPPGLLPAGSHLPAFFLAAALTLFAFTFNQLRYLPLLDNVALPVWALRGFPLVAAILVTPVVLISGAPLLAAGRREWQTRQPGLDALLVLVALLAYGTSLLSWLAGSDRLYFDLAGLAITLGLAGRALSDLIRRRTLAAAQQLLRRGAKSATLLRPSAGGMAEVEVALVDVRPGDLLWVRPGQRIPADGLVEWGTAILDETLLTGEAQPVTHAAGEHVVAGAVNLTGAFALRVQATGDASELARLAGLLGEVDRLATALESTVQQHVRHAAPALLLTAFAIGMGVAWRSGSAWPALAAVTAFLLAATPVTLVVVAPLAAWLAADWGAAHGILIRDPAVLERAARLKRLILDKTGTLTEGRLDLTGLVVPAPVDEAALLRRVAVLERGSEHPVAQAVQRAAQQRGLDISDLPDEFRALPGGGVAGRVAQSDLVVGNERLLAGLDLAPPAALVAQGRPLEQAGQTVVYIACAGEVQGLLALSDTPKPTAAADVWRLQGLGLAVEIVTGDNAVTAQLVADAVGVRRVVANVRPQEKAAVIAGYQEAGDCVAMVGDGLNDVPALAQADVGIALGRGTDVAGAAAGMLLLRDDLGGVTEALLLARRTQAVVRQNARLAWIPHVLVALPAALAWFDPPALALGATLAALVLVGGSSLRLRIRES